MPAMTIDKREAKKVAPKPPAKTSAGQRPKKAAFKKASAKTK